MGLLGTIGRGLLRAAPYVAAPFTGGASLAAAPMANNLANKFAGDNPGRADRIMSAGSNIAGMMGGRFGGGGGGQQGGGQGIGPSQGMLSNIMGIFGGGGGSGGGQGGRGRFGTPDFNPQARSGGQGSSGIDFGGIMSRIPELMSRGTKPPQQQMGGGQSPMGSQGYNPYDANPNLGYGIEAGRQDAMRNQPWRQAPISPDPSMQLPNIYPQYDPSQRGIGPRAQPRY